MRKLKINKWKYKKTSNFIETCHDTSSSKEMSTKLYQKQVWYQFSFLYILDTVLDQLFINSINIYMTELFSETSKKWCRNKWAFFKKPKQQFSGSSKINRKKCEPS